MIHFVKRTAAIRLDHRKVHEEPFHREAEPSSGQGKGAETVDQDAGGRRRRRPRPGAIRSRIFVDSLRDGNGTGTVLLVWLSLEDEMSSNSDPAECSQPPPDSPHMLKRIRELEESHAKLKAEMEKIIKRQDISPSPGSSVSRSLSMSPPPRTHSKQQKWRALSDKLSGMDLSASSSSASTVPSDEGMEYRYSKILDSMGQAVYIFSTSAEVTYWNLMAEQLYGYTASEAMGRNILELLIDRSDSNSLETATSLVAQICMGESWVGQFPLRKKSGEVFPAMITNTPLFGDDGRLLGIIGVSSDARPFMRPGTMWKRSQQQDNWQLPLVSTISSLANKILSNLRGSPDSSDSAVQPRGPGLKSVPWMSKSGRLWPWSGIAEGDAMSERAERAERVERVDLLTLTNDVNNSMSSLGSMTSTASSSSSSQFGQSFDDLEAPEYEITWDSITMHEPIGQGSAATVYRGTWSGVDVAVKVFNEQQYPEVVLEDFRKEVAIMKNLRHPNVLLFLGAITSRDHLCIVSELMPRGSLFRLLHRRTQPLEWKRKLQMALDVVRGINYLHTRKPPIIHRDLKSTNLLVDRQLKVKVGDFSLSRFKHANFLTANAKMGTSQWMAPEVLRSEPSNERSDIYSFGVILWELATEEVPWKDLDPLQVVAAVGFMNRRLEIPKGLDPRIAAIIQDCWSSEWQERPTCDELSCRLQEVSRELS